MPRDAVSRTANGYCMCMYILTQVYIYMHIYPAGNTTAIRCAQLSEGLSAIRCPQLWPPSLKPLRPSHHYRIKGYGLIIDPSLCRETNISRTTTRLIVSSSPSLTYIVSTIDSEEFKGGTRGAPIMPRDAVSRTANADCSFPSLHIHYTEKTGIRFPFKLNGI